MMKSCRTKNIDIDGNTVICIEKYSEDGSSNGIVTDVFDTKNVQLSSHSVIYYDESKQIQFEILIHYRDNYTMIKSYFRDGSLKGESKTVDGEYVLYRVYNEDGSIKRTTH